MYNSVAEFVGNTPIFRLQNMFQDLKPNIYLKMEQFNPGGSIKDRTALGLLQYEELQGRLKPPMTIIESSSGNTAIGLSIFAKTKGYRVIAICDRHLPEVKKTRLRAFGADIIFLPPTPVGMDTVELRIAVASYLADNVPNAITLGQYSNPGNPEIHYQTTGPEIWRDMAGKVSAVVVAVGTCGTIAGVGRYFKEQHPTVKIIGAEPVGSVIFGGENGKYLVQGGGLSFIPAVFDPKVVDQGVKVPDADSFGHIREIALQEGWMLGGTGGVVLGGIRQIADQFGPNDNIVGIIPDGGERYIDTLFDDTWVRNQGCGDKIYTGKVSDDKTVHVAQSIGCSVNDIPETTGYTLEDLCKEINFEFSF